jgi:hypothetical protein
VVLRGLSTDGTDAAAQTCALGLRNALNEVASHAVDPTVRAAATAAAAPPDDYDDAAEGIGACDACGGTGKTEGGDCEACGGIGNVVPLGAKAAGDDAVPPVRRRVRPRPVDDSSDNGAAGDVLQLPPRHRAQDAAAGDGGGAARRPVRRRLRRRPDADDSTDDGAAQLNPLPKVDAGSDGDKGSGDEGDASSSDSSATCCECHGCGCETCDDSGRIAYLQRDAGRNVYGPFRNTSGDCGVPPFGSRGVSAGGVCLSQSKGPHVHLGSE